MAFVAVMLLSRPVIDAMCHAFFKTTTFPRGQLPDRFIVALRDLAPPVLEKAILPARWKDVTALQASGKKFTFLLPAKGGRIPTPADLYAYNVIEDRKASQIIEVHFVNTHTSWTRYEAFDDRSCRFPAVLTAAFSR